MKLNPKMGFWGAKHGLRKDILFKTKFGLIWEKKTMENKKKKGRRGREEEEKRRRNEEAKFKVWNHEY